MTASFLYKLWRLCFLDVTDIARTLLGINPLEGGFELKYGAASNGEVVGTDIASLYNNYFVPMALSFLITVVVIILLQKLAFEGITKEAGIKVMIGFLISFMVITNGLKIGRNVIKLGNAAALKIYDNSAILTGEAVNSDKTDEATGTEGDQSLNNLNNFLKTIDPELEIAKDGEGYKYKSNGGGFGGYLFSMAYKLVPSMFAGLLILFFVLGNFVCIGVMGSVLITRMLELVLKVLGIPIAALEFSLNGYNSSSMRYLKSLIAVSIQGVFIVLILWLKARMSLILIKIIGESTRGAYGGMIFIVLTLAVTAAFTGMLIKSQQYAKEVVGV